MRPTEDTAELGQLLRGGPFHLALRAALAARGLPLHRVQHRLAAQGIKVGVTSLSYWQQGARRPRHPESLRAVTALERILELPDGALLRLLAAEDPGPGSARPPTRSYRALFSMGGTVERLLDGMDRRTAGCTRSATTSGSASDRRASCGSASRSRSSGRTATASTATSPSTTATPAATCPGCA